MTGASGPRVAFFVGPSVPPAEFRAACAAIQGHVSILPPVEQGDLLRLLTDRPDIVGIVDGYFFQAPAVLHKEILLMLEHGARVLGAASLGALRAAELDAFGMEGVGVIYGMYRRGVIDGDHEVAVLHAEPAGAYRPLTEPLVNVRHNLRRARAQGVISTRAAAALLAHAQRLYFAELTYDILLDRANSSVISEAERTALCRFLREQAVDLKRTDALALVQTVAERVNGTRPWPPSIPTTANVTRYFGQYLRAYVGRPAAGQHVPDRLVLAFEKLLCPTFQRVYHHVARRCVALEEASHHGLPDMEPAVLLDRFRQERRLHTDEQMAAWLRAHDLTLHELAAALAERDLERRLLDRYRARFPEARTRAALHRRIMADTAARLGLDRAALTRPLLLGRDLPWDGPLLREMKLRGTYRPALERAGRILRFSAEHARQHPDRPLSRLKRSRLEAWTAARWGVPADTLGRAILDRGFTSDAEFDEAVRYAYLWERYGAEADAATAALP